MKSSQERAAEKREEKLKEVADQVRDGSLVVRQMTDEERAKFPPREPGEAKPARPKYRV